LQLQINLTLKTAPCFG